MNIIIDPFLNDEKVIQHIIDSLEETEIIVGDCSHKHIPKESISMVPIDNIFDKINEEREDLKGDSPIKSYNHIRNRNKGYKRNPYR